MSFSRINKAFLNRVRVLSKVFSETDLTAAALTQTLDVGDVPPGAHVVGVNLRGFTPFTGGGITAFTCSICDANDDDCLVAAANIFAAAVDGQTPTRPLGIAPHKRYAAATAGAVTVEILYAIPGVGE